jgi:glycerophosphoryl diester phosphodiesterase
MYPPPSHHKIIGHRGASGHAPENTRASLIKAHDLGLQVVEFDVRLSSDGEIILFHDSTLNRTTNGKGRVFDRTYQSLSELDAGSWFHPSFSDQRILRFFEAIALIQKLKLAVILDIKVDEDQELVITNKIIELLDKHWPHTITKPLLSSFSIACLSQLQSLSKQYDRVLLLHDYRSDWHEVCLQLECAAIHIDYQVLSESWLNEIKRANIVLRAYTVNDLAIAEKLFADGVESIITDFPDRMSKYLKLSSNA